MIWGVLLPLVAATNCDWVQALSDEASIRKAAEDPACVLPKTVSEWIELLPTSFRSNWVASTSSDSAQPAHLPEVSKGETLRHAGFRFFMRGKAPNQNTLTFSFSTNPDHDLTGGFDPSVELSVWDRKTKTLVMVDINLKRKSIRTNPDSCKMCHESRNKHLWDPGLADYLPSKTYPNGTAWLNQYRGLYEKCETESCDARDLEIWKRIRNLDWKNNQGRAENYLEEISIENIERFGGLLKKWDRFPEVRSKVLDILANPDSRNPKEKSVSVYLTHTQNFFEQQYQRQIEVTRALDPRGNAAPLPHRWQAGNFLRTPQGMASANALAALDELIDLHSSPHDTAPSISEMALLHGYIPVVNLFDPARIAQALSEW